MKKKTFFKMFGIQVSLYFHQFIVNNYNFSKHCYYYYYILLQRNYMLQSLFEKKKTFKNRLFPFSIVSLKCLNTRKGLYGCCSRIWVGRSNFTRWMYFLFYFSQDQISQDRISQDRIYIFFFTRSKTRSKVFLMRSKV